MASPTTTIELPRIEGESARAYQARTQYVAMGPQRSLERLRQQIGNRSVRYLEIWSSQFGWSDSARQYDEQVAYLTIQDAASQYQEDLKAFRIKYGKAGDDLHKVSTAMLSLFARHLQGKTVVDKDGNKHVIPAVEMNANTLGQIKSALQAAADLEALALRVEGLLSEPRSE
jgi:hypothetical protein